MKNIFLELDVSGTKGNEAWIGIEQPKGFILADLKKMEVPQCQHTEKEVHSEGEWREISVQIEENFFNDAVVFYKGIDRILAVETED